jgi:transcriptional regulator with XRE-family HTH domain
MAREISQEDRSVAAAIKDFGKLKFGTMAAFAGAMNVSTQYLNAYTSAAKRPGPVFMQRLAELGFDMTEIPDSYKTKVYSLSQNTPSAANSPLPTLRFHDAFKVLGAPEDVALDVEASPTQVRNWISGKAQPSPHQLALLFNEVSRAAATLANALMKAHCGYGAEGLEEDKLKDGTSE